MIKLAPASANAIAQADGLKVEAEKEAMHAEQVAKKVRHNAKANALKYVTQMQEEKKDADVEHANDISEKKKETFDLIKFLAPK